MNRIFANSSALTDQYKEAINELVRKLNLAFDELYYVGVLRDLPDRPVQLFIVTQRMLHSEPMPTNCTDEWMNALVERARRHLAHANGKMYYVDSMYQVVDGVFASMVLHMVLQDSKVVNFIAEMLTEEGFDLPGEAGWINGSAQVQ